MIASERKGRKSLAGEVTSRSGNKSVKVSYFYKGQHPKYLKEVRRKTVVHAHDENNSCAVGDRVLIMETRPLSHLKRWRVVSVIGRVSS
ncbi:MAG: 30S ribosomal protein S17 [Puniceicoccales bacterium]|jgi:small subunit ribosomal protein S17|nr:30S ribosomal protein S17 [Puniceicoccales bacterium]